MIFRLGKITILIMFLLGILLTPTGWVWAAEGSEDNLSVGRISLLGTEPVGFNEWFQLDNALLTERFAQYQQSENQQEPQNTLLLLEEEWRLINLELQSLLRTPSYQDLKRGYNIYDADTSGKIHVLGLAKLARENWILAFFHGNLMDKRASDLYPALLELAYFEGENNGFRKLSYSRSDQYVTVDETRSILDKINLPDQVFNDYRIFLLPYQINEANGFSFSANLPLREECVFISAKVGISGGKDTTEPTLVHEFGHYLHLQFIGDYSFNPSVWNEYLRIRGKNLFVEQGEWSQLTEENFAEDFKMLFGDSLAKEEGHRGSYGDPDRQKILGSKLRNFFYQIANQEPLLSLPLEEVMVSNGPLTDWDYLNPSPGIRHLEVLVTDRSRLVVGGSLASPTQKDSQIGLWVKGPGMGQTEPQPLELIQVGDSLGFKKNIDLPKAGRYELMLGELNLSQQRFIIYYPMEVFYLPKQT